MSTHFPKVVIRGARRRVQGTHQMYEEFKILHLEEESSCLILFYLIAFVQLTKLVRNHFMLLERRVNLELFQ